MIDTHPLNLHYFSKNEIFFQENVKQLIEELGVYWKQSGIEFPYFRKKYSLWAKKKNEKHLENFINFLQNMQEKNTDPLNDILLHKRIFSQVQTFFANALGYQDNQINLIFSNEFKKSSTMFVKMARHFDEKLSKSEIFQACRNVWIMNGIQLLMGRKVELTPAIFAYSLLYPYSDNYLDDTDISLGEKKAFNIRFANRLAGEPDLPNSRHEQKVFQLVGMIEQQFDRTRYPKVFESLLAIHKAQSKSLQLFSGHKKISENQILEISLDKGGTSVLADGYLVAGNLSPLQARFLFGYGAYLQFVDDLQDVAEDKKAGQLTVFSFLPDNQNIDLVVNRVFQFGENVLNLHQDFKGRFARDYIDVMQKSINLMMIEAALFAENYIGKTYFTHLERYSPFRFKFLKNCQIKHSSYYHSMMGKLI